MKCRLCNGDSTPVSGCLSVCANCIRENFEDAEPQIRQAHLGSRKAFGLPAAAPRTALGVKCDLCVNECSIAAGGLGYCGARRNTDGQITGGVDTANLSFYYDPLPTNCVADWVCPGGCGAGYPQFALRRGPEYGYKNLAVFYHSCTFNCLFCQNWHYRKETGREIRVTAEELAGAADERTSCICYFGGDPTPSIIHSLQAARIARGGKKEILRICWETNGSMNPQYLRQVAELCLESGGCIKFDMKAFNENLHLALTGASNKRTLANVSFLKPYIEKRPVPPLFIASTLIVPGYVDSQEVRHISRFLASVSPDIPYALLAFHPQFLMHDLPATSRQHAELCCEAARGEGLKQVRVGNLHLLGDAYEMK